MPASEWIEDCATCGRPAIGTLGENGPAVCDTHAQELQPWYVTSMIRPYSEGPVFVVRVYHAEEADHAIEQAEDAFPDERVICATISEPVFYGSVKA